LRCNRKSGRQHARIHSDYKNKPTAANGHKSKIMYAFIKSKDSERNNPILAISCEIETLAMSDTYGNYGQKVSPSDAGDYCLLLTQNAVKVANEYNEQNDNENSYVIDDVINAYEDRYLYNNLSESCKEGDLEFYKATLEGFNYYDGNNWATVSVDADFGETSHTFVKDEELIKKLNEAIESKEWVNDGFGTKTYQTDEFIIIDNFCQGHFESFEIYERDEYEMTTMSEY